VATCLSAGSSLCAAAPACPAIPLAPGSSLRSVGQDMVVNGVSMSIRLLASEQAPDALLAFYRQKWAGTAGKPGNIEYELAPWKVIASGREGCFYTVQVQGAGRGSTALLGVSRGPAVAAPGAGFPMMAGSKVRNDYQSEDSGKNGRLLVFSNRFSSGGNADFYRGQLAREGWSLMREQSPAGHAHARVLVFRRSASWLEMVIKQGPAATELVVNIND